MSNQPEFRSRAGTAEEWYTKKGDSIEGFLVDIQEGVGKYKSTLYQLKQQDKSIKKIWGSTVIDNQMAGVAIGTYVKIEYLGQEESKGGGSYKNFEVFDAPSMGTPESFFGEKSIQRTAEKATPIATKETAPASNTDDGADDLPF